MHVLEFLEAAEELRLDEVGVLGFLGFLAGLAVGLRIGFWFLVVLGLEFRVFYFV